MAVRKMTLFVTLMACLALAGPAWAGTLQFHGNNFAGQGALNFTPGIGNALTIGPGGGGSGAFISDFFNTTGFCGGDCPIIGGFMTLTTGGETSGSTGGGAFLYSFGSGGVIKITGEIPILGINSPTVLFMANLLSGTFTGAGSIGSLTVGINLASIVLVPQLGKYHFTGGNNDDISFNVSPSCSTGGVCTGAIIQSDTTFQTIPEPATLSVLGVGLFTFGTGLRRRILSRQAS
jgi:hypothetical protein